MVSPKHAFYLNASKRLSKKVNLTFYFLHTEIKRSDSVPSQDHTANDSSNWCFERSKMQWYVFCGWFSWFLGRQLANKWLCNTQNWLFCIVLVVRLRHVQFSRKNRRSFAWKCSVREQLLLDLAHLETPIQSTANYFRGHKRKSTIHHLLQCHRRVSKHRDRIFGTFLSTNRHEPCFERLTNYVGSNANKFSLTVKCSCNIECMLVPLMPKVVSISW